GDARDRAQVRQPGQGESRLGDPVGRNDAAAHGMGRGGGSGGERHGRGHFGQDGHLRFRAADGRRDRSEVLGVRRSDHRQHVIWKFGNLEIWESGNLRTMNRKVTVVGGAGNVGATVARAIADKELADVVIIDIADQKAKGVALDMYEACPIEGSDARIIGAGADEAGWKETANSDVVVVTSGVPRKPGMSRDDLLNVNYKIMQSVTEQIVKYSPNTIIVPVANPLDAMCQAVYRLSRFPRERVIGMAGGVHSGRRRAVVASRAGAWGARTSTRSSSAVTATRWCRCRATRRSPASRCRSTRG